MGEGVGDEEREDGCLAAEAGDREAEGELRLEMELGYRYFSLPGSESFSSPGPSTETEEREAGYESDEIRASEEKREGWLC